MKSARRHAQQGYNEQKKDTFVKGNTLTKQKKPIHGRPASSGGPQKSHPKKVELHPNKVEPRPAIFSKNRFKNKGKPPSSFLTHKGGAKLGMPENPLSDYDLGKIDLGEDVEGKDKMFDGDKKDKEMMMGGGGMEGEAPLDDIVIPPGGKDGGYIDKDMIPGDLAPQGQPKPAKPDFPDGQDHQPFPVPAGGRNAVEMVRKPPINTGQFHPANPANLPGSMDLPGGVPHQNQAGNGRDISQLAEWIKQFHQNQPGRPQQNVPNQNQNLPNQKWNQPPDQPGIQPAGQNTANQILMPDQNGNQPRPPQSLDQPNPDLNGDQLKQNGNGPEWDGNQPAQKVPDSLPADRTGGGVAPGSGPYVRSSTPTGRPLAVPHTPRQQAVVRTFQSAWKVYKDHAWGKDEVNPISRTSSNGNFNMGMTLVDTLDTIWLMGLEDDFDRARNWVAQHLTFEHVGTVSLFETNIRVLGGLLSAYHLSGDKVFLDKAVSLVVLCMKPPTKDPPRKGQPPNLLDPFSHSIRLFYDLQKEDTLSMEDKMACPLIGGSTLVKIVPASSLCDMVYRT